MKLETDDALLDLFACVAAAALLMLLLCVVGGCDKNNPRSDRNPYNPVVAPTSPPSPTPAPSPSPTPEPGRHHHGGHR